MNKLCLTSQHFNFQEILDQNDPEILTQFILDPTSSNLKKRVSTSDPILIGIFKLFKRYLQLCSLEENEDAKQIKKIMKNPFNQ